VNSEMIKCFCDKRYQCDPRDTKVSDTDTA
jgi:hypothetical protein